MSASGVKRVHFFLTCQTRGAISTSAPEFANYRLSIASCIPTRFRFSELATLFFMCWWFTPRVRRSVGELSYCRMNTCHCYGFKTSVENAIQPVLHVQCFSFIIFLGSVYYSFDKVHGYMCVWGGGRWFVSWILLICLQSPLIWGCCMILVCSLFFFSVPSTPHPTHWIPQPPFAKRHCHNNKATSRLLIHQCTQQLKHGMGHFNSIGTLTQLSNLYDTLYCLWPQADFHQKHILDPPKARPWSTKSIRAACLGYRTAYEQSWYWGRIASSYR